MRPVRIAAMLLIPMAASGCASIANERVNTISEGLKEPSLALYGSTHIAGEALDAFIEKRVARVFTGGIVYRHRKDPDRVKIVSASNGLAAAVSKQGYFLTAAHCVNTHDDIVVVLASASALRGYPARIVWISHDYDIALVSIGKSVEYCFEIGLGTSDPRRTVIAGGSLGHSAGHLLSESKASSREDGLMLIKHNCPIVDGDSGGPLIAEDGLLLGINHSTSWRIKPFAFTISHYAATAMASAWIEELIRRDLEMSRHAAGPEVP